MNLCEIWLKTKDNNLEEILKVGDLLEFNGEYFSDAYCFDKGDLYEVLEVTISFFKLKTKFNEGETFVDIHPDGFSSFNLITDGNNEGEV